MSRWLTSPSASVTEIVQSPSALNAWVTASLLSSYLSPGRSNIVPLNRICPTGFHFSSQRNESNPSRKCLLAGLALLWASSPLRSVAGCWARSRRRRAPPCPALLCLRRFLAAVLRILCVRSTPSSPSAGSGACGAGNVPAALLRRLFPPGISHTLPKGRQASVGHSSASFASSQKTTGEERK